MDAIAVNIVPAAINSNFAAIKSQLSRELEDYDFVVTACTVKHAKEKATELNKLSSDIDQRRKREVAIASEPIKAFESQAKELVSMCQEVRKRILDQVRVFEAETLAACRDLLQLRLDHGYTSNGIDQEFRAATIDGMEKLSWITGSGRLTAAATAAVDALVNDCKIKQQTTEIRLSQLENASHRAGLHSPLTREHVEGILFSAEDEYQSRLQNLIAREFARQEETERRAMEKLERERRQKAEAEAEAARDAIQSAEPEHEPQAELKPDQETVEQQPAEAPSAKYGDGMKSVLVEVLLVVHVPSSVTAEQVREQLIGRLRQAGVENSIVSCCAVDVADEVSQ